MGNPQVMTASAVISFAETFEESLSAFYTQLAERFPQRRETFVALAEACKKNRISISRTYRETISDALEAGFSFEGLDLRAYTVEEGLAAHAGYGQALERAIELENQAVELYQDLAKRSRSLLATIAMAFANVAKTHIKQRLRLQSLR